MEIKLTFEGIAIFVTIVGFMMTLVGKQWASDRKLFSTIEALQDRQALFEKTINTYNEHLQDLALTTEKTINTYNETLKNIRDHMIENSKEHAVLMERIGRDP